MNIYVDYLGNCWTIEEQADGSMIYTNTITGEKAISGKTWYSVNTDDVERLLSL